jgi:hypothetical protein
LPHTGLDFAWNQLEGNVSVFGLYCQLWKHRHRPVVLDDVDGLYAQRDGIR